MSTKCQDKLDPKDESKINSLLTQLNNLSDEINTKDSDFNYALKKFNNFSNFVISELNRLSSKYPKQIQRFYVNQERQAYLTEICKLANQLTQSLLNHQDNAQQLHSEVSRLEKLIPNSGTEREGILFKMNGLLQEIEDMSHNESLLKKYHNNLMTTIYSIQKETDLENKDIGKDYDKYKEYFEEKSKLLEAMVEHRDILGKIDSERDLLKAKYSETMSDLNQLSIQMSINAKKNVSEKQSNNDFDIDNSSNDKETMPPDNAVKIETVPKENFNREGLTLDLQSDKEYSLSSEKSRTISQELDGKSQVIE